MATKLPGETYRGHTIHVPLSADGQVAAYVWPLRVLTLMSGGSCGGPTIGVEVGNEEVLRFDCHDAPGHWHAGGYDRLERPRDSHREFPDDVKRTADQVNWAFGQIRDNVKTLLAEANHSEAAELIEPELVEAGIEAIRAHLDQSGDLRGAAIEEKLITL